MSANASEPKPDRRQLEQEISRTRAELAQTLDELTTRVDPRVHASNAARQAKQAATDTGSLFTGGGMPDEDPARSRNVKILLLGAAAGLAVVAATVLGRRS
ncbi:DUF3618 domain-containing protein [Cellulosimicrobium arenosum]|uniref:DUF3618 domain-containing protein n=1 Tax=Cellulosimicrobium arenosum TaxID=2708133 RepID=A0A927IZN0_9MICO|nr:DUF3618 domain-containing protein [Cellulosimicrobium arenosum]